MIFSMRVEKRFSRSHLKCCSLTLRPISFSKSGRAQVVFASGYNKWELSEDYQSFEFLEKPISVDDLKVVLEKLRSKIEN